MQRRIARIAAKPLCATCVRNTAGGQILCEPCAVSWQNLQQPFVAPPAGSPNPVAAAVLGLIPGVGAMYNGQFIKGLIHVVIFAVIISITTHYGVFGLFIPAWVLYQAFEAYHTAVARRDGLAVARSAGIERSRQLAECQPHAESGAGAGGICESESWSGRAGTGRAGQAGQGQAPGGYQPGQYQAPYIGQYQAPPYGQAPYTPVAGFADPEAPPVPPVPPIHWRRKEPIGAIDSGRHRTAAFAERDGLCGRAFPALSVATAVYRTRRVADYPPHG